MDQQPSQSLVPLFDNLEPTQPVTQHLIQQIDNLMLTNWENGFHCITALRSINKFFPQCIVEVVNRYLAQITDLISTGKTQIVKNALALVKELFSRGKVLNVQKSVYTFTPVLIKKSATEHGHLKKMAEEALEAFANNCGYDISFVIVSEYMSDKNIAIAELCIRQLAKLIENLGVNIAQLKPQTLRGIMKALTSLIVGKRQNLKNMALEICMYVFRLVGSNNYYNLMVCTLDAEEVQIMGNAMNAHKQVKPKPHVDGKTFRKTMMAEKKHQQIMGGFNVQNGSMENVNPFDQQSMGNLGLNRFNSTPW